MKPDFRFWLINKYRTKIHACKDEEEAIQWMCNLSSQRFIQYANEYAEEYLKTEKYVESDEHIDKCCKEAYTDGHNDGYKLGYEKGLYDMRWQTNTARIYALPYYCNIKIGSRSGSCS
jgi:hypothetical protein